MSAAAIRVQTWRSPVDSDFAGVSHGWERSYWTPWRAYLVR